VADPHPFFQYTSEVLAWRLGSPGRPRPAPPSDPADTAKRAGRVCRHAAGRQGVILAGLGAGDLAAALARDLPAEVALTVLCLDPDTARSLIGAGRLAWATPQGSRQLLVDTSALALFALLAMAGWTPDTALATVNPEPTRPEEQRRLAQWRRFFAGTRPAPEPSAGTEAPPQPTLAVLARPDEPDLPGFFAAVSGLAGRAAVLWDAADVPGAAREAERLGVPVTHLARRLADDFAAQRNALLAACPEGWVLTLDPDERPGPGFSEALGRVMGMPGIGGAYFPRTTLHPRPDRALVGYGLWPDLQLRLFRTGPPGQPRYVRPVHERLEGLTGRAVLALDAPILHLNRRLADEAAVTAKLAGFDAAAGAPLHRLNPDYPSLPLEYLQPPLGLPPGGRVLLPPPLW
jgi:hypothetical protein